MKVLAAVLGIALAGIIAWLAFGMPHRVGGASDKPAALSSSEHGRPGSRGQPLDVPLPPAEQARQDLDMKRLPFYRMLRDQYANVVLRFGVTGDQDTLDLVVAQSDDATVNGLVSSVVAPNAKTYGFRRVRFFVKSPAGSVDPVTIVAESSQSESGGWTTWRK